MSQEAHSITVKSGGFFSNVPVLKVRGESDLWCASAIEAVCVVTDRNRTWYWWLVLLPFTLLFFIAALVQYAINWIFPQEVKLGTVVSLAWLSVVVMLGFITFTHQKLLPRASIVISEDLGFLRRYGAEIGLALGVISILASVLMWLAPRAV